MTDKSSFYKCGSKVAYKNTFSYGQNGFVNKQRTYARLGKV
jgi:hypothetical protein